MAQGLEKLADINCGCPSELYDKVAKENECYEWEKIIREMAEGFAMIEKIDNAILDYDVESDMEKFHKAVDSFKKHIFALWD